MHCPVVSVSVPDQNLHLLSAVTRDHQSGTGSMSLDVYLALLQAKHRDGHCARETPRAPPLWGRALASCHVQPGPWEPPSIRASRGAALLSTAVFRPLWAGSTHLLLLPVAGESWELHGGRRHGQ